MAYHLMLMIHTHAHCPPNEAPVLQSTPRRSIPETFWKAAKVPALLAWTPFRAINTIYLKSMTPNQVSGQGDRHNTMALRPPRAQQRTGRIICWSHHDQRQMGRGDNNA
jgi:hypothetical protein